MAKIASLRNFPAASEKGLYYLESFASKYVNGNRILSPTFSFSTSISNTTTGFSALGKMVGMTPLVLNSDSTISSLLAISDDSKIFHYAHVSGTSRGLIHTNTDGGSAGDVFTTDNENLLYTGATRLGIGLRVVAKAGSGSLKLIDTDGRNFGTLGISNAAGHNKVYNLTQGVEYTVTGVSNANATNDQIDIAAGTPATGDYCIAFNDEGYGTDIDFFTPTAYPQYKSQKSQGAIIHQIRQFNTGEYYILNGNYLAQLNADEHTWNANAKQFPNNTEGTCFAINQGMILIGASFKGKGRLLLWNGFSDGFLSTVELERVPQAVEAYNNGWVVSVGSELYFTNGYSITRIATLPDADFFDATATVAYNGMKIISDRIYLNVILQGFNRAKTGTWIYDMQAGWSFLPSLSSSGQFLTGHTVGALQSVVSNNQNRLFASFSSLTPAPNSDTSFIGRISEQTGYRPSTTILLELGEEYNVKGVELSLGIKNLGNRTAGSATTATVSVAMGDARQQLYRYFSAGTSNTTTTIKNTSAATLGNEGIVGQQVRVFRGAAAGERTYIQSIASPGTSSEVLTVSPALSAAPSDSQSCGILNLKLCGSKTITNLALPERGQLKFLNAGGILTDKVFVEVYVTGTDSDLIEIHGIDVVV